MAETVDPRTGRVVWGMAAAVAILVVVSIVAVLTSGDPAVFGLDRPEGVVQHFVAALIDGDVTGARRYLDEGSAGERCDLSTPGAEADARVVLRSVTRSEDRATVRVGITQVQGFGFFGDASYDDEFELERHGGTWTITWVPWPFADCYVAGKAS